MSCPACGRSERRRLYCQRPWCGLSAQTEGARGRLTRALARLTSAEETVREVAEAAYSAAQEAPAGERRALLALAERGSDFLVAVRAARAL